MDTQEYKVTKLKKATLNYTAYKAIKKRILNGDIPEGTKLSEIQMGNQLGVSATPVREAFRMLDTEGLLKIVPYKGAIVTSYSPLAALEATQCREALECMALRLYMQSDKVEAGIATLQEMLKQAENTEYIDDFVKISSAIHDIWIKGCGNAKVAELITQLKSVILRESNMSANDKKRRKEIIKEHYKLLEAMQNKNADIACEALYVHLENGYLYGRDKNMVK